MATLQPLTVHQVESRENQSFHSNRHDQISEDIRTPTRDSFAAANGKRTLPMSPTEEESSQDSPMRNDLRREGSHRSSNSQVIQDQDIDMGVSDEEGEGSENDSQDDGTERPSKKKKKGQRFFCTEYPPCNLSFTRSEHLARHIRCGLVDNSLEWALIFPPENIPVNDHFNAIAQDAFLDWIIFGSTLRPCM